MIESMPTQVGTATASPTTAKSQNHPKTTTPTEASPETDVVALSEEAKALRAEALKTEALEALDAETSVGPVLPGQLTADQRDEIAKLSLRDRAVRSREAAQIGAAGGRAGVSAMSYSTGPDGRQYATAGEVRISTGEGVNPAATLLRARQIRAVALSAGGPSGAGNQAAAAAAQLETMALIQQSTASSEANHATDQIALERRIANLEAIAEQAEQQVVRAQIETQTPEVDTEAPQRRAAKAYAAASTDTG